MKIGDLVSIKGHPFLSKETGIILRHNLLADEGHRWTVLVSSKVYAFATHELHRKNDNVEMTHKGDQSEY